MYALPRVRLNDEELAVVIRQRWKDGMPGTASIGEWLVKLLEQHLEYGVDEVVIVDKRNPRSVLVEMKQYMRVVAVVAESDEV